MTRRAIPYWHVDAFAEREFTGNQAAVMLLEEWLADDILQTIADENMFAETAYVIPDASGEADYELRWFTPACEIRLCGHATLASGHVLLTRDGANKVTFRTRKAGVLEVRRIEGGSYEVVLPAIITQQKPFPEAVASLGRAPIEIWRNSDNYDLFLYASEEEVRALTPDFTTLAELGHDSFTCTALGKETDVVSRVFVPGAGVDEDSVTGSAHAVLTPFWAKKLGRDNFTAYQASSRGGYVNCRLEGDRAILGGGCVTVVEGQFYLSG